MSTEPTSPPLDTERRLTKRFDLRTETPTTAVVKAVEAYTGTDGDRRPPLHRSIDPDSLNETLTPPATDALGELVSVTFLYAGYWVTISNDGLVTVVEKTPGTTENDTLPSPE